MILLSLAPNVKAAITTRQGGVSLAPFDSNNFGLHVGDNPAHVQHNRQKLQQSLEGVRAIQWLDQVHGCAVVEASAAGAVPKADACFSRTPGIACAVLSADCLPVLLYALDGSQVAAVHAGWRGLANGVLLETLKTFPKGCALGAYLGPAIGPSAFEVGPEVRDAFASHCKRSEANHSTPVIASAAKQSTATHGSPRHYVPRDDDTAARHCDAVMARAFTQGLGDRLYANLYLLAREQLRRAGVCVIQGGDYCTFTDTEHFYSYRRDGQTGRMASLIWQS